MYLYFVFVFDICFMTNTFIINMTVSTYMVLHMYGYTENKEMNECLVIPAAACLPNLGSLGAIIIVQWA